MKQAHTSFPRGFQGFPGASCPPLPSGNRSISAKGFGILAFAFIAWAGLADSASAATLTVTNTNDSGAGSLRQAIAGATAGDVIVFDAPLSGTTITVASEIVVDTNLTIDASDLSAGITLSGGGVLPGQGTQRILRVNATRVVNLKGLRFFNGSASVNPNINGGSLYNAGTTTVELCTFVGSKAASFGGAIFSDFNATLNVLNSSFSQNTSTAYGGAVASFGVMVVEGSTFNSNSADQGGGIYSNSTSALTVTNSTFAANSAVSYGGAIFNGIEGSLSGAKMQLFSVTIAGNTALGGITSKGGGVYNDILAVPFPEITNSIISLNQSTDGADIFGGYNSTHSYIGGDPKLSPLGNYGGPTQTMRPLPDSPVIDFAGATTSLSTDQRGQPRILVGGLDLGAVEVPFSDYSGTGLTIHTRVLSGGTTGVFEISTDPNFDPTVSTYAGTGVSGKSDGPRLSAQLSLPAGVARDVDGNIFFADSANNRICMIGADGWVVTIAGTGAFGSLDGSGATAEFKIPSGVAVGPDGNVYVADTFGHRIRKLTRPSTVGGSWAVTTLAGSGTAGFKDGSSLSAQFNFPYGLAADADGNIYVADSSNHRIRKIAAITFDVSTYAGPTTAIPVASGLVDTDGVVGSNSSMARFQNPKGIVVLGGNLYVADTDNDVIRKIVIEEDTELRFVDTYAGSTVGFADNNNPLLAQFDTPSGIASDGVATLFVADQGNRRVRQITGSGVVSTVAGTGAAGMVNGKTDVATFQAPTAITVGLDGNLVVADQQNHALRGIAIQPLSVPSTLTLTDVAGVPGEQVNTVLDVNALGLAPGVTYYIRWRDSLGNTQVIGQSFYLYDFPEVETKPASGLTPSGAQLNANVDPKNGRTAVTLEYSTDPNLLHPYQVSTTAGSGVAGFANGTGAAAQFSNPSGVVVNASGEIFVADRLNHRIRKITPAGEVTTFAGSGVAGFANGTGTAAQFEKPAGLAIDSSGNIYVADEQNHRIRKITPAGVVTTLAGSGVAGFNDDVSAAAQFLYPTGVAVDASGNVYVADSGNHRIRLILADGSSVTTYAGSGVPGISNGGRLAAQFTSPKSVAIGSGNTIVVSDTGNHRIRVIDPLNVNTLAGDGTDGFLNGVGSVARFSSPEGIVFHAATNLFYVADSGNHRIRTILSDGSQVGTLAGSGVAGTLDSPTGELHPATASQFNLPQGIAVGSTGILYVTQEGLLRKIARSDELPYVTVNPDADGTGARDVSALVDVPLRYGTTYYFRARATSYRSTVTGEILSFVTTQAMKEVFDGASTSAAQLEDDQTQKVDFGSTPTGQPLLRSFTVFNPGTAPLTVSSLDIPAGFVLSGPSFGTIAAGASATVNVVMSADTAGTYEGDIVITSNAQEQTTFTFPITGLVLDPPLVIGMQATNQGTSTATFNAFVTPQGSSTTVWFEWSLDPDFDGVNVSTLAGTTAGYNDGLGTVAQFNQPSGLAVDQNGNTYVADTANHRIRKIAPDGTTSTFAGSGTAGSANGTGVAAEFSSPVGIAINSTGTLFVSDSGNHRIRAITPEGVVSTFAGLGTPGFTDGIPAAARFNNPSGLAIDATGQLYVADTGNHRVRKVATNGAVSTLAGTGVAGAADGAGNVAQFNSPAGIARDADGYVYLTEVSTHAIRRIAADGTTITFAGSVNTSGYSDANDLSARFSNPAGLAIAVDGTILVADKGNHRIRSVSPAGVVKTVAGSGTQGVVDGLGDVAQFSGPASLATRPTGGFIVGETGSSVIREIDSIQVLLQAAAGLNGFDLLSVELPVTGLPASGTYYYRAIATNGGGTTIGATMTENVTPPLTGYEAWQETYFTTQAGNDLVAGPVAAPAGDGIPNLLKYAFNLNPPQQSAAGEMPQAVLDKVANKLSITYTKVLDATDVDYIVEWSPNLVDWYDAGITQEEVADPDPETTQFKASVDASTTAKFLRVRVVIQ